MPSVQRRLFIYPACHLPAQQRRDRPPATAILWPRRSFAPSSIQHLPLLRPGPPRLIPSNLPNGLALPKLAAAIHAQVQSHTSLLFFGPLPSITESHPQRACFHPSKSCCRAPTRAASIHKSPTLSFLDRLANTPAQRSSLPIRPPFWL